MTSSLPFDTSKFDELPISIIICKPVLNADGSVRDYRIVFGNEPFAELWQTLSKTDDFIGKFFGENFSGDNFFSTPLNNLPAPYVGFVLNDLTEHNKKFAHNHFMKMVRQTEVATVLLRDTHDGRFEVVFVSKGFAKLVECSVDEATDFFRENGVIAFTHPDDRARRDALVQRHAHIH